MFRHDSVQGTGASNGDSFALQQHGTRTLTSLPPLSALTSNTTTTMHVGNGGWTRRSKSSAQSDESFSAYLHHPSSSSPALDRILDKTRYSAQRGPAAANVRDYGPLAAPPLPHHRRMPSLDAVGYAQERSTPYHVRPTPQRFSIRDVLSMHEHDRSAIRSSCTSPWRDSEEARQRQHDMTSLYASPYGPRVSLREDDAEDLASDESFERIDAEGTAEDVSDLHDDSSFVDDAEKKRRRRRTNKDEANVLAAVFDKTAFPDVSTREALASRLDMSLRSVSIWFQNRRQAMKKRASRFGGVEGVRGASVAGMNGMTSMHDDEGSTETKHALKPWLSLDEVATRACGDTPDEESVQVAEPSFDLLQAAAQPSAQRTSSAPLLDLLRKRNGHRSLERIASMPCIAAVLGNDQKSVNVASVPSFVKPADKDLRRVLDDIAIVKASRQERTPSVGLVRSASMTALPTLARSDEESSSRLSNDCSIFVNTDRKESLPAPLDVVSHAANATLAKPSEHREIWKRMKSSSSGLSSETNTPESDKENKPIAIFEKQDDFEDEEKTLRRIAQRRALKREQKVLSAEGSKYVIEADARLALQKRTTSTADKAKTAGARQPLAPLPRVSGAIVPPPPRAFSRSRSEGTALSRGGLARVTSLDFEAGRDRSKEVERPTIALHSLSQILRASRLNKSRTRSHADRRHRRRSTNEVHGSQEATKSASSRTRIHQSTTTVNGAKGRFEPSLSAPMISHENLPLGLRERTRTQRQSSAESSFDLSRDSRASSEGGGSEEWLEQWARDQDRSSSQAVKRKSPEQAVYGERRMASAGAHDDSGFFGSDEASDHENDDGELLRKRRMIASGKSDKPRIPFGPLRATSINASPPSKAPPLTSSSPLKRGDERDRLAAETLLAFGSHA